jgi:hypothetical protein
MQGSVTGFLLTLLLVLPVEAHAQPGEPSSVACAENGACPDQGRMRSMILGRVGAGLAISSLAFIPAGFLLATIIDLNNPGDDIANAGGRALAPLFASSTFWAVLHIVGGALLVDAHVKSKRMLGLGADRSLSIVGPILYTLAVVSLCVSGTLAAALASYGAYSAAAGLWAAGYVTGIVTGAVAIRSTRLVGASIAPGVLAGGAGVSISGWF